MAKKIMAWSKCKIEIAEALSHEVMPDDESFESVGVILNQSSTLSAEAGDKMQAIATGGEVVAEEPQEGTLTLETTIIEPTHELLHLLGLTDTELAEEGEEEVADVTMKTHVVEGDWAVKVTPKNEGAWGIKAPKCSITYLPAWSEENGNQAVLQISILKTTERLTTYHRKTSTGWVAYMSSAIPSNVAGWVLEAAELPDNAATNAIYGIIGNYWYQRFQTDSPLD